MLNILHILINDSHIEKLLKKLYVLILIICNDLIVDSQLDGNVTAKELSEYFKELVEEFESIEKAKKNSNSKDSPLDR